MKLYSGPLSLFTAKVRVALAEKGLAYDRTEVPWSVAARYEPKHPDVVALNPKQQVPVLVDGDVAVYDSTQIFEYLEDRYPDPPLYPRDVAGRARCRRLEAAADEIVFPAVWDLIETTFYPGAKDEVASRPRARRSSPPSTRRSTRSSPAAPTCAATSRVADIATFILLHAAAGLGAPIDERHTALRAWLDRMHARPAVKREVDETSRFLKALFSPPAYGPARGRERGRARARRARAP